MTVLVPLAMFGWIPVGLMLFLVLPVRKAIIAAYLVGWLFLPQAGYPVSGLPDYTRMTAVNLVVFLGAALCDPNRMFGVRPRVWDLPVLVLCLCPFPTSLSNGLGVYDGLSGVLECTLTWGVPYIIGRIYFSEPETLRLLAIGVFVGGLIYMPLCWYEMRMSPQLHRILYGFNPTKYHMAWRLGGYRPMMFLSHGIEVGLWMCASALLGMWLWLSGSVRSVSSVPMKWLAPLLFITAVLCRSLNALAVMTLGLATLLALHYLRLKWALAVFLLVPMGYIALRAPKVWYPEVLISLAQSIDADRAMSLESRINQEEILTEKAWRRPILGWGGWGRNRVYDDKGESVTVTDALWVITFGQRGFLGLIALMLAFALPGMLLLVRLAPACLRSPQMAAAVGLSACVGMYAADTLMNAMLNPIYHVMIGGVMGLTIALAERRWHPATVKTTRRSARPPLGVPSRTAPSIPW